jgi:hypothetical protein
MFLAFHSLTYVVISYKMSKPVKKIHSFILLVFVKLMFKVSTSRNFNNVG